MPNSDLCTEDEITSLVHGFYARVRADTALGPIFNAHVQDWDTHLAKMVDFWSSTLRGTGRFRGTPMPKHIGLPGLTAELFKRWLALFDQTTAPMANVPMRERANELARRIAESLWYGYQMSNGTEALPRGL